MSTRHDRRERLLTQEDDDVAQEVAGILKQDGVKVLLNSKAERHLEQALAWIPEDAETLKLLQEVRPKKPLSGERKTPSGIFGRKG